MKLALNIAWSSKHYTHSPGEHVITAALLAIPHVWLGNASSLMTCYYYTPDAGNKANISPAN